MLNKIELINWKLEFVCYLEFVIYKVMCMTIPYKVKTIKDNIVVGIIGDQEKEFKLDLVETKVEVGDYFLAQNSYVLQIIKDEDAKNLMKLFN